MWTMAFVAAGAVWGWPAVAIAFKPTFAPLALIGASRRSTWLGAIPVAIFVIVTWGLWADWLTVIEDASLAPTYSLLNVPLVAIPVVAWLGKGPRPASNRFRSR
jgi:hypothetical protein